MKQENLMLATNRQAKTKPGMETKVPNEKLYTQVQCGL